MHKFAVRLKAQSPCTLIMAFPLSHEVVAVVVLMAAAKFVTNIVLYVGWI